MQSLVWYSRPFWALKRHYYIFLLSSFYSIPSIQSLKRYRNQTIGHLMDVQHMHSTSSSYFEAPQSFCSKYSWRCSFKAKVSHLSIFVCLLISKRYLIYSCCYCATVSWIIVSKFLIFILFFSYRIFCKKWLQ